MAYQVLARKWRPSNFSEMVGQEHVVKALTTALESERLHHAYLFTGTRGVGKTTVARLIAKSLNCETGVTAEPCGQCASCIEIAEGRSVDVLEVDAASRTKVEDTRDLLDNVQYAPTRSRFKIYLIDEVHMLSNHSFNALLKTLEEPPEHVKFLLATTDPQKLPATVLSRCLQFNLKNMVPQQIIDHLRRVLAEESVSFDDESLALLARGAEGSMRDALSLTDQAIAHGSGKLAADEVRQMLGTVSRTKVFDLLDAIVANDPKLALAVVEDIASHSPDYAGTLDELASVLHQISLAQAVPGSVDSTLPEHERLASLAQGMTADDAHLWWQMAVAAKRELYLASDPRAGLDMAVLRMIAFRPAVVLTDASEVPPAKKPEPPVMPVEPATTPQQQPSISSDRPNNEAGSADQMASEQGVVSSKRASAPASGVFAAENLAPAVEVADKPSHAPVEAPTRAATSVAPLGSNNGAADVSQVPPKNVIEVPDGAKPPDEDLPTHGSWPDFFEGLGLKGVIHTVASHFELSVAFDRTLCFRLSPANAMLFNERHQRGLASAIEQVLEEPVTVQVALGETSDKTPAYQRELLEQQRLSAARQALESDDCLNALLTDFDAIVLPESVRPPLVEL
ncbi:MAG: DNA polymerase III subunit gamma/tau [Pseudomonadota bacterium]|nr:DNA polymerase III subunit gamma/tau [Pseudomonadota bacterium]